MYSIYIDGCTKDGGIYRYIMDEKGEINFSEKYACENPMYSILRDNKFYTLLRYGSEGLSTLIANETEEEKIGREIYKVSTLGHEACHLEKAGDEIFAVNYTSGSVFKTPDVLKVHKDREIKGEKVKLDRQEMPHTHCVILTPDKKYLAVTDLGLDKIFIYDFDLNLISETKVEDGLGPRHIIFDGDILYSICELGNTLLSFKYYGGKLTLIDSIKTLPENFDGYDISAAIRIKGDKVYVSNRGSNTIAVFKKNEGKLSKIGTFSTFGNWPRDFDIIGDILICCNELSNTVTLFKLNEEGIGEKPFKTLSIPAPLCIVYKEI